MSRLHITDTDEAFRMGHFAGVKGYSCLRPAGVTFTKAARKAYQAGWEAGLDARMTA